MFKNFCKSSFFLSIALQQTYVVEKNCLLIDSYSHVVKIILIYQKQVVLKASKY